MNHKTPIAFLFIGLLLIASCNNPTETIVMESEQIIDAVPSASGVVYTKNAYWLIGDDASFLYKMNMDNQILEKFRISSLNNKKNGRLLKGLKPDFEALDLIDNNLLILGSGSKEISRDTAVLFNLTSKKVVQKKSLRKLYDRFLFVGGFDSTKSINIEAFVSDKNYCYLMHRGNVCGKNVIFQIEKNQWKTYWETNELPDVQSHFVELPKIDGYLSGFSGACLSADGQYLLFTSSVEATKDVYHDGEVLGSFVGSIPIKGEQAWLSHKAFLLKHKDHIVKTKLESISVINYLDGVYQLLAVSDNDNGKSGIYHLTLNQ
ncbi:MAG: hypothetical protein B7C24_03945 [Bacteroidetes bacterium 4572_77]|nr:MAG: hypothetical protein B7C24_03945 [Bacteroidetes bacterium 4572_77]